MTLQRIVRGHPARIRLAGSRRGLNMRSCRSPIVVVLALVALMVCGRTGFAAAHAQAAARMSDQAFAMLSALTAASGGGNPNPALGPMAVFAGDAQTLSHALAVGDRTAASSAIAALETDRKSVDGAAASHPGGFDVNEWNGIKRQLAALAAVVPAAAPVPPTVPAVASGAAAAAGAKPASAAPAAPASAAIAGASGGSVPPAAAGAALGGAPRIVIESRIAEGDSIRVKGYMEGSNLRHAGLYENGRELRAFQIGQVAGPERISFNLGLGNPSAGTTIRAYDANGRMGEAFVLAAGAAAGSGATGGGAAAANAPAIPAMPPSGVSTEEAGVEVDRNTTGSGRTNLAVIPSYGAPRPSPSKRHTMASRLGGVHIDVIALNQVQTTPPVYEIVGQIQGRGVSRAGIYINGRLVHRIPVSRGVGLNSFDQRFTLEGGAPTIRAYTMGDRFIEMSIDPNAALASIGTPPAAAPMTGGTMLGGGTMMGAPMLGGTMTGGGIAIQIAAVGAISPNLDVVSGVISGNRVARAGLYQNGMLVQAIPVGHGIGAFIGSLLPGHSNNVNFNVRYNPQAGPATIRAFDSSGAYAEQPVVAGGATVNPYAGGAPSYGMSSGTYAPGMSPYGMSPYGAYAPGMSPYGMSPYGSSGYPASPYGASPYPANPYSSGTFGAPPINPYTTPTNPFGGPATR